MPTPSAPQGWEFYLQLGQVEAAFGNRKGDLGLRPVFHQAMPRSQAHLFIAFLPCCLHVTLARRWRDLAPGLTPRPVLEKLRALQRLDVPLPTTDGRAVLLTRYPQPEADQRLIVEKRKLPLPEPPPPQITEAQVRRA